VTTIFKTDVTETLYNALGLAVGGRTSKWKRTCAMSTFARAVSRGLNADWMECWPPKTAVCGRNADPSHTANHHLAAWHDNPVGRHSGRSAFRHRSKIAATNFYI